MNPPAPATGLYTRILSKEGVTGLLLFMFSTFLMTIIYQGQQKHEAILTDIKAEELKQTKKLEEGNEILEDIRYALRENGGLVFRNQP